MKEVSGEVRGRDGGGERCKIKFVRLAKDMRWSNNVTSNLKLEKNIRNFYVVRNGMVL